MEALPRQVQDWFGRPTDWPPASPFRAAKDELELHLSLLDSRQDGWPIIRRRLFPARLPGAVDAVYIPEDQLTWRRRLRKHGRYAMHLGSRLRRHLAALPAAAASCVRWWRRTR